MWPDGRRVEDDDVGVGALLQCSFRAGGRRSSSLWAGIRLIFRMASIRVMLPFSRTYWASTREKVPALRGWPARIAGDHHQRMGNYLVYYFLRIGEDHHRVRRGGIMQLLEALLGQALAGFG